MGRGHPDVRPGLRGGASVGQEGRVQRHRGRPGFPGHSEGVLLNLAQAVFKRRWLLVAVNSTIQAKLPVYSDNNWQARTLVNVVNNLKDHGLFY